jgi:Mn-dependent DtxR family transcriptional regulator
MNAYHARLRDDILIVLSNGETQRTSTALAQECGVLRPSLSRAIQRMKREGIVQRADRNWYLTNEGRRIVDSFW